MLVAVACKNSETATVQSEHLRHPPGFARTAGGSYVAIEVTNPGRITGTVTVAGDLPPDTVVHPTSDVQICGAELTDVAIEHDGEKLGGAVVWLDGLHSGKALPLVKRYDVVNEGCLVRPRVQAAAVGGTLNVRSRDPIAHRTRLLREGETTPVALVLETDDGQVVPLDHALDRAGLIEMRCDMHPWTRGWIAVFDHPYFQVTGPDGGFSLDSVPPGQYTLHVWHERLGGITRPVTVEGSGTAKVELELRYDASGKR
ncbi:MAG TPA: carboxypeptidase regulatory-like domain-containing protein [Gemmatimonadaceae bacterium]|nr:carboxypeptidase regulatory-like domain-containing protein [Gemmatimonadaceae bacterium]